MEKGIHRDQILAPWMDPGKLVVATVDEVVVGGGDAIIEERTRVGMFNRRREPSSSFCYILLGHTF